MQAKENQHREAATLQGSKEDFLQHYDLHDRLGQGKFGIVFLGINKQTRLKVAIKSISVREANKNKVEYEFHLQNRLHNPYVVTLCDNILYQTPEYYYVIMEPCVKDFKEILADHKGPMPEHKVRHVVHSVAKGLEYLHSYRIVHRDIALKNILINEKGEIKIADFGLALMVHKKSGSIKGEKCGTPEYMAPEMIQNEEYFFEVDNWALGIAMYYLIHNHSPYHAGPFSIQIIPTAVINFYAKMTPHAADVLTRLLYKDPTARITSSQLLEHPWFSQELVKVKHVPSLTNASIDSGRGSSIASSVQSSVKSSTSRAPVRSNSCSGRPAPNGPPIQAQLFNQVYTEHQPQRMLQHHQPVERARNAAPISPLHTALNSNSIHLSQNQHLSQIHTPPPPQPVMATNAYYGMGHQYPQNYSQHSHQMSQVMSSSQYPYVQSPELIMPKQQYHPQIQLPNKAKKEAKKLIEKPPRITLGSTSLISTCLVTRSNKVSSLMGKILAMQLFDKGPNKESDIVMWLDLDLDEIWIYYVKGHGGPKDPVPDRSRAINSPAPRRFKYEDLPAKNYAYYKHLSNYLETVLTKSPKVTIKSGIYKSVLYANGQFIMFIDPKNLSSRQSISITRQNYSLVTAVILGDDVHTLQDLRVPAQVSQKCHNAQQLVALAHRMYQKCLVAERFDEEEWQKDPTMRPFPIVKGQLS